MTLSPTNILSSEYKNYTNNLVKKHSSEYLPQQNLGGISRENRNRILKSHEMQHQGNSQYFGDENTYKSILQDNSKIQEILKKQQIIEINLYNIYYKVI